MLYLSRLILDTHARMVRRDLADCHQLHRRILGAFPEAAPEVNAREHFGLLYRMESFERDPRLLRVLVQSAVEPDWSGLPDTYVADSPDERGNPAVRRVDAEYDQISSGMSFSFRLRANPTKRISTNNTEQAEKWRGKRIELRREEDQLAWLERKGEQGGFSILRADVQPDIVDARTANLEKVRGRRPAQRDTAPMPLRFGAVLFEGRLEVVDQALFLVALRNGIGSGKAFGFGLLSIASVS